MKTVFVIPVCNEAPTLAGLAEGIRRHGPENHEIVFVDDGSTDDSYRVITELREKYAEVHAIRLRRNFGKTLALAAAFARIDGDIVVMMDGDLQDDPEEIPKLLDKLEEGYDLVCGWKQDRKDPWHKTLPSRVYNAAIARLFRLPLHDVNTGFKAMRMEVAKRLPLYGDLHRMIAVHAAAMGYKVAEVPVKHHPRRFGKSQYGLDRFVRGALDVFSTFFLIRHGQSPNQVFGLAGCALLAFGSLALLLGLAAVVFLPWCLGGAETPVRIGAALMTMVWLLFAFLLLLWASLALLGGLLAELFLNRLARPDPSVHVAEEHWD